MALTLGDNFSYQGAKPLDGRLNYNTLATMKAVSDATMYEGCMAYCAETDKTYQWKSGNTVDPDTGKWREFSSGGGGGTSDYSDLTNKPSINGVTLSGNKTTSDLDISYNDLKNKPTIPSIDNCYKTDDTAFTALADGDYVPVYDTSATTKKKTLWSNIKSVLKTYFDTLYNNYALPTATTSTLGGVKIGNNMTITDGAISPVIPTYGFTPVGTVISLMGKSAPTNYLSCDGTVYNISTYPELADYFMAQFGSKNYFGGNGTTTFAVPDLRGEFLRGTGTNSHANSGNGAAVGAHQEGTSIPNIATWSGTSSGILGDTSSTVEIGNADKGIRTGTGTNQWVKATGTTGTTGLTTNKSVVRPTNTSVLYCIATKDIYSNPAYDYSTTEKVVGTWIDGKPIYQKTFTGTLTKTTVLGTEAATNVAMGVSIDKYIDIQGYVNNTSIGVFQGFNLFASANNNGLRFTANTNTHSTNPNNIILANGWFLIDTTYYLTIQYTKTT